MKVRIHRLSDNPLPTRANPTDAGYDVYAAEDVNFEPNQIKLVPLGIIAEAPVGHHFKLYIRSSMALKRGFTLGNSVGIVDSSFCGPQDQIQAIIKAPARYTTCWLNICFEDLHIKKGERVGQLILEKNIEIEWDEQENRNFAGESRGGFGSSGR